MPNQIVVEGIKEFRAALKELGDPTATKEFKLAGYNAAAEVVVPRAQGRASALGRMQSAAAATLQPKKTVTGGAVSFGQGVPFAMGAEFGAAQDQLRNTQRGTIRGSNQFEAWRGNGSDAGYFLWPTIRDDAEEIVGKFAEGIDKLTQRLGWR